MRLINIFCGCPLTTDLACVRTSLSYCVRLLPRPASSLAVTRGWAAGSRWNRWPGVFRPGHGGYNIYTNIYCGVLTLPEAGYQLAQLLVSGPVRLLAGTGAVGHHQAARTRAVLPHLAAHKISSPKFSVPSPYSNWDAAKPPLFGWRNQKLCSNTH